MDDSIPISDDELLRRAVGRARIRRGCGKHIRWSAVAETFCLGSTFSQRLCRRFGFDPDEMIQR